MKKIKIYENEESYQNDLANGLSELDNYLAYSKNNSIVHLKNKYVAYYSVSQHLIDSIQPMYDGKLPLISRCDLFKSITINGNKLDLSDKVREPYKFKTSGTDLTFELGSLILSGDSSFNEKFVLAKHFDTPENGIIELELNDGVNSLIGAFMFSICVTSIDPKIFNDFKSDSLMSIFSTCSSLKDLNLSYLNSIDSNSMFSMFGNCNDLQHIIMKNLNTSKITDMNSMFMSCNSILDLDLTHFDTSNVTNMYSMFLNCKKLKVLDLSNFDTSKVTDMERMFDGCSNLEELKLNNFSTDNVIDSDNMFNKCDSLNEITCKQEFKDWCIEHQSEINLPISMRERGGEKWNVI